MFWLMQLIKMNIPVITGSPLLLAKAELPLCVNDVRYSNSVTLPLTDFWHIFVLTQLQRDENESYLVNRNMRAPVIYSSRCEGAQWLAKHGQIDAIILKDGV